MENLEELHCHSTEVKLENGGAQIIFDYEDGLVYAIDNNRLVIYEENKLNDSGTVHKIDATGTLCHVKYLSIFNIVFLATDNEFILYDNENEETLFTLVIENSIIDISWNPIETLFVAIHKDFQIISYICTRHFIEPKDKTSLNSSVPVSVFSGWGSISTQFQGPKKFKPNVSITDTTADQVLQPVSDAPPKISWRGNGELFVVNYYSNGKRFLKVFNDDLTALNQSEPYENLQEQVAFMGQGQCIASCASKSNGDTQLMVFEKNCKIKGEFEMPEIEGSVKKLRYHPQMNILAICYINKQNFGFINIYLHSNGRWFLKQQLCYSPEHEIPNFEWMNLHEHLFTTCKMVVFTSQNIEYHYFRFIISRSPNAATVAVINGRRMDFTLFDKKIIPPPFSYYSFEHDRPINRILFHPIQNMCILVDSMFHIKILKLDDYAVEDLITLNEHTFIGNVTFKHVNWQVQGLEIILQNNMGINTVSKENNEISVSLKTEKTSPFILLPYSDTQLMLPYKMIHPTNNYIYLTKHTIDEGSKKLSFEFALTINRDFHVNDVLVCSGVTSFYIFKEYLIFTHANSRLYCLRLHDHLIYSNEINLNNVFNREIEQGGIIVTCTNLISPQIILQMPRGNIETISCKMITIDVIDHKLEENKWAEVLHILRIEKVNWNVLIDLNPERFRTHIEDFVKSAKNNTILTNIVTEFCLNENCFQTFYKNYSPFRSTKLDYDKRSILEDILLYLVSTNCVSNLSSIVAIQQKHISLKSAIKSIQDVFNYDKVKNEATCSRILKQVLIQEHFKDVENAVYNLFDLDFLSLVYHNSMEDPKVYEPEIRSYRTMNIIERKFKMCIRGRNLSTAVKYLLRWETADEDFITNFIVKNHLEDIAYFSIEDYHKHFVMVTLLYAKKLSILRRYVEAGMILKKGELYQEALLEYKNGLEWREVTALCSKLNYDKEEEVIMFKELAASLVKENKIEDAVILLETYRKDHRAAIEVLVQNHVFRRAMCLAETYRENGLIETQIKPELIEYMSLLLEKINNFSNQFKTYTNRLEIVREEKISKLHMTSLGVYDEQDDLYSETSSHVTSSSSRVTSKSRGTTASSRNRRKEDKKKIAIKEGGFYEDIALIRALHILYTEVFNFGEEVKEICLVGYQYNFHLTRQLHSDLVTLQNFMIENISIIWSETFLKEEESTDYTIAAITQNKQDLDPEYRIPPSSKKAKSWRLEIFS